MRSRILYTAGAATFGTGAYYGLRHYQHLQHEINVLPGKSETFEPVIDLEPQMEAPEVDQESSIAAAFLSGSSAGAAVAYTTFPFESLKKMLQRHDVRARELANREKMSALFAKERFRPFRGAPVFAVNIVPTTAIQLTTDRVLKKVLPDDASAKTLAMAAATCGVTGAITATPIENFVTRLQVMNSDEYRMKNNVPASKQRFTNYEVIKDMFQQGPMRPMRSFPMIATRDATFTFYMLFASDKIAQMARNNIADNDAVAFSARFVSSIGGAAFSHIFDTVGTNMQKSHDPIKAYEVASAIIKQSGFRGLLSGLPPRVALFFAFSNMIPYVQKQTDPTAEKVVSAVKSGFSMFASKPRVEVVDVEKDNEQQNSVKNRN